MMPTDIWPLDETPVLVAVVTRPADLARAQTEGWYRLPVAHAPRRLACEILALYQTGALGAAGRCIQGWAAVWQVRLATRRELLPAEAGHPRADALYYRFDLGPWQTLARPIPARRLRRVTFIATTWGRLMTATDVAHLWPRVKGTMVLAEALRYHGGTEDTEARG